MLKGAGVRFVCLRAALKLLVQAIEQNVAIQSALNAASKREAARS